MKTTVVNLRREPFDVYIGRAGRDKKTGELRNGQFGNPFKRSVPHCLAHFEDYFVSRISTDSNFKQAVLELHGKRLGCFCKPGPCHGDIIAAWVDAQFAVRGTSLIDLCYPIDKAVRQDQEDLFRG